MNTSNLCACFVTPYTLPVSQLKMKNVARFDNQEESDNTNIYWKIAD